MKRVLRAISVLRSSSDQSILIISDTPYIAGDSLAFTESTQDTVLLKTWEISPTLIRIRKDIYHEPFQESTSAQGDLQRPH